MESVVILQYEEQFGQMVAERMLPLVDVPGVVVTSVTPAEEWPALLMLFPDKDSADRFAAHLSRQFWTWATSTIPRPPFFVGVRTLRGEKAALALARVILGRAETVRTPFGWAAGMLQLQHGDAPADGASALYRTIQTAALPAVET